MWPLVTVENAASLLVHAELPTALADIVAGDDFGDENQSTLPPNNSDTHMYKNTHLTASFPG